MVRATPIVALDVPDAHSAHDLVQRLGASCDFYKVGLELFAAEGPAIVTWLRERDKRVFVDLKLHDIPNTVRSAARSVARLGADLLTVHAAGGEAMVAAAVAGAGEGSATAARPCGILGVTILTSLDGDAVGAAWGRPPVQVGDEVLRLAGVVRAGGGVGIVCSGHEASAVNRTFGEDLGILVPGIRLADGERHDQRRTMTPTEAADASARWLVLGRAVTASADPGRTMDEVLAMLREGRGGSGLESPGEA